ncbi:MAG: c-type cytochrome [Rhodocyclaceae bacterium]|nr:c-type cytochrome [Rhodocyclaceae bacterium]MBX3668486.1 c-type cytochrome [Rhodocyclaceae bacterium]
MIIWRTSISARGPGLGTRVRGAVQLAAVLAALSIPLSASAFDEDAARALGKRNDCFKCHSVDKTKKGPSYKKIAAKYKGKADADAKLTEHLKTSPKVKLEDGTEEEHKAIDTKDAKEIKNLIEWILAQ